MRVTNFSCQRRNRTFILSLKKPKGKVSHLNASCKSPNGTIAMLFPSHHCLLQQFQEASLDQNLGVAEVIGLKWCLVNRALRLDTIVPCAAFISLDLCGGSLWSSRCSWTPTPINPGLANWGLWEVESWQHLEGHRFSICGLENWYWLQFWVGSWQRFSWWDLSHGNYLVITAMMDGIASGHSGKFKFACCC